MEKTLKIIAGAALIWFGVLRGASAMVVGIRSWVLKRIDAIAGEMTVVLNFMIKNPLFVGLTLKGVEGSIYIQGKKVGTIDHPMDYYLSGGHTHVIPVSVDLDLHDLGQAAILNIQSGDVRTLTVAFTGKLFVGAHSVGVPVEVSLNWNDLTR